MSNTASSTMKHTPTPWFARPQPDGRFDVLDGPNLNTATVLCTRFEYSKREDEMHANAAFIVRACNNHAQLINALQGSRVAIDVLMARLIEMDPSFRPSESPAWSALVAVNEALAAAGAQ